MAKYVHSRSGTPVWFLLSVQWFRVQDVEINSLIGKYIWSGTLC